MTAFLLVVAVLAALGLVTAGLEALAIYVAARKVAALVASYKGKS